MEPMRYFSGVIAILSLGCFSCHNVQEKPTAQLEIKRPASWSAASSGTNGKISTGWLKEFEDTRMNELVFEALKYNHNLKAAAHRLRSAKRGTIIGRAARLPRVTAGGGYSRSGGKRNNTSESYSASLNTSWEIDLWGRLRDTEQIQHANYRVELARYRNARLSIAANTAQGWCNLVTAERQLELAKTTLASFQKALPAVERGYLASTLRSVDLQFARSNIANAERSIRIRQRARDDAATSLELLLGRYPSAEIASSTDLPSLKNDVPTGIPAGLIARRPDLEIARAQLFISAKNADIQRKELLPSLVLSGGASNNGRDTIRRVLDPNFLIYSVASNLSQTVYGGGRLKAQAQQALDQNREEIESYAQTALIAFREVEAALTADQSLREQEHFLEQEVKQTTSAESRTLRDITLGVPGASFLDYLEAQRRAETARASLIQLRNSRLQNRIDLHLALGGDFSTKLR